MPRRRLPAQASQLYHRHPTPTPTPSHTPGYADPVRFLARITAIGPDWIKLDRTLPVKVTRAASHLLPPRPSTAAPRRLPAAAGLGAGRARGGQARAARAAAAARLTRAPSSHGRRPPALNYAPQTRRRQVDMAWKPEIHK